MSEKTCQFCISWRSAGTGYAANQPADICQNPKISSNFHARRVYENLVVVHPKDNLVNLTPIDGVSCNGYNTFPEPEQYVKTGRDFGCILFKPHFINKNKNE
jgi:hypothetical protein